MATITYKGSAIATLNGGQTTTLKCAGMMMESDVVVEAAKQKNPVLQDKTITENGTYSADSGYDGLGIVTVEVAGSGGSTEEWIGDGNTHIWISLAEGRTSPMLGVCPNGTVTVDWGDGTTQDVLTGTSTDAVVWTPTHEYAKPGDYIITLTVDGEMAIKGDSSSGSCILRFDTSSDYRNRIYIASVSKVEIGRDVTSIAGYAFQNCYSLTSVNIAEGVSIIGTYAFRECNALQSINIPNGVASIENEAFKNCYSLTSINIPEGATTVGAYAFQYCYALSAVSNKSSAKYIFVNTFEGCRNLSCVEFPDGVTMIANYAFSNCYSLASVDIPGSVTQIGTSAFNNCTGVRYYDFSKHTAVPALSNTNAFTNIPADCEIRVPAALYDQWIAATNWTTYASKIVAV